MSDADGDLLFNLGIDKCILSWLQNEKRQLETAMVVESRIRNKRNVSRRSLADTQDGLEQSEVSPASLLLFAMLFYKRQVAWSYGDMQCRSKAAGLLQIRRRKQV